MLGAFLFKSLGHINFLFPHGQHRNVSTQIGQGKFFVEKPVSKHNETDATTPILLL